MAFQEVMRERYTQAIEEITGRKVVAFMSGSHQNPDLICEVFVLDPNEATSEARRAQVRAPSPPGSGARPTSP